jgi:membrane protein implicated in regulation of membrane protease activity
MFQEFLASGTLNLVYAILILVSFIFAVITLVGAEVGDALDLDVDVDVDADTGIDIASVSPFAMAMFGATFGLTGLITRIWFEMEAVPSILWAVGVGIVIGGLAQVLFIYVLSPSHSSHFSLVDDAMGRDVEVIVTIPDNGLGQIAYDNISGRVTLGARSVDGRQIKRGESVTIEKITGRVAFVRPVKS